MQPSRHIPLAGASNFRDFGGYPTADGRQVKWRLLYRSDRLCDLTAEDYVALAPHRIRFVYDLRRDSEVAEAPTIWRGEPAPELIRAMMMPDSAGPNTFQRIAADETARHDANITRKIMRRMYENMLSLPAPIAAYGMIFQRLGELDAFPALFHCAGGKDRTGAVAALILDLLGVAREDIAEDFMLTGLYYDAANSLKNRVSQIVSTAEIGHWSEEALVPIFGVERDYIETFLDILAAEGGAERFLTDKAGVEPAALARVRAALLA